MSISMAEPQLLHSISLRRAPGAALMIAVFMFTSGGWTFPTPSDAIQKGQTFLLNLFDPDVDLLPEYRGANVYWLFHDNYLAAKVLAQRHPETAKRIMAAIHREGIHKSGTIELLFGEADKPLPFRQYELMDVRRATNKVIRTEVVTDRVLYGWEDYADLRLLACIAETNQPTAREHWEATLRFWDGKGFLDAAARHNHRYSTYKLGLALLAASHLSPPAQPPHALVDKLLALQDQSGGWITDYDAMGNQIGLANVETTCLAILGLEALTRGKQSPTK